MPKNVTLLWVALGLMPSTVLADAGSNAPRREAVYEAKFGQLFSDPYRWMENPDDAELRTWVAAENARLADQTRGPLFDAVLSDFREMFSDAPLAATAKMTERMFDHRDNRRHDIRFRHRPTIPIPDVVAPESGLEFSDGISSNGRYEVVFNADAYRDLGRLTVVDHEQNTPGLRLRDSLTVRFARVFWETDDTFLYTTGITGRAAGPQFGLYRHRLGTLQEQDELLFGVTEPGASFSLIRAGEKWFVDLFVGGVSTFGRFDIATGAVEPLFPSQKEIFSVLAYDGTSFYFADFRTTPSAKS